MLLTEEEFQALSSLAGQTNVVILQAGQMLEAIAASPLAANLPRDWQQGRNELSAGGLRALRRELAAGPARDPLRVGLLLDLLARLAEESLPDLRLRVAAATASGDDAVRRDFALAARDARLLPR